MGRDRGRGHDYRDNCNCGPCQGERHERSLEEKADWAPARTQPPHTGVIEGTDEVVSFKTKGDDTLIADGDYHKDNDGFSYNEDGSKGHDHYGPWGGTDRGQYTGPGA